MSPLLYIIGIVMIVSGLVSGMAIISDIDWTGYRIAKITASTNQLGWILVKNSVITQLSLGVLSIISGVIGGIFFFSIGTIINLLRRIADKDISKLTAPAENSIVEKLNIK